LLTTFAFIKLGPLALRLPPTALLAFSPNTSAFFHLLWKPQKLLGAQVKTDLKKPAFMPSPLEKQTLFLHK
jgi:hypothetical protein